MAESDSSEDVSFWREASSATHAHAAAAARLGLTAQESKGRPLPAKPKHRIQKVKRLLKQQERKTEALTRRHKAICNAANASVVRSADVFAPTSDSNVAKSRHWTPEGILAVSFIFDTLTNKMMQTLFGIVSSSARAAIIAVANLCLRLSLKALSAVVCDWQSDHGNGAPKVLVIKRMWDETRHKLRAEASISNAALRNVLKRIPTQSLPTTKPGRAKNKVKKQTTMQFKRAAMSASRISCKVRNKMIKFSNRKVNITLQVMAQRLWLRWGSGIKDAAACLLPPYIIENATATNMLHAFDTKTAPVSMAALQEALKQPHRPWLLYVLLSDRAKSNRKLAMHVESQFKDLDTGFVIDTRCCAHQAATVAEDVIQEHELLNSMYAAGHLMQMSCTIGPLLEALNFLLDTPGYIIIYHCVPPLQENLHYSKAVMQHTLLHSMQKVFNLHGGYTSLPESLLLACQPRQDLSCFKTHLDLYVCLLCLQTDFAFSYIQSAEEDSV